MAVNGAAAWPDLSTDHPLSVLIAKLDSILTEADYDEVYGISLRTASPFHRNLNVSSATQPIPDFGDGVDPYQCIQVHDYLSVSFLRQDAYAKAAAKKAIVTFQNYYPETLSRKMFVNVPVVMGWFFSAASMMLSKETLRKFFVITYGTDLAGVSGSSVPTVHGGKSGDLESTAETLRLEN